MHVYSSRTGGGVLTAPDKLSSGTFALTVAMVVALLAMYFSTSHIVTLAGLAVATAFALAVLSKGELAFVAVASSVVAIARAAAEGELSLFLALIGFARLFPGVAAVAGGIKLLRALILGGTCPCDDECEDDDCEDDKDHEGDDNSGVVGVSEDGEALNEEAVRRAARILVIYIPVALTATLVFMYWLGVDVLTTFSTFIIVAYGADVLSIGSRNRFLMFPLVVAGYVAGGTALYFATARLLGVVDTLRNQVTWIMNAVFLVSFATVVWKRAVGRQRKSG